MPNVKKKRVCVCVKLLEFGAKKGDILVKNSSSLMAF